ncbi:MAG: hypothetical protein ABJB55_01695 [Actinomycetota bacterium]
MLGLALGGVLADALIENDVATAATQPFTMFGTVFELSTPALIAIAFGLGALAILLVLAGVRRFRRGRRRLLHQRIETLQDENARLAVKRNLETVIRVPEATPLEPRQPLEAVDPIEPVEPRAPVPPPPPEPVAEEAKPASKW